MPSNPGMAEKESEISQSRSAPLDAIGRVRPEYCQIGHAVAQAEPLTPSPSRSEFPTTSQPTYARVKASRPTDSKRLTLRISRSACSAAVLQTVP